MRRAKFRQLTNSAIKINKTSHALAVEQSLFVYKINKKQQLLPIFAKNA